VAVKVVPFASLGADHPEAALAVAEAELLQAVDELPAGNFLAPELPAESLEGNFNVPEGIAHLFSKLFIFNKIEVKRASLSTADENLCKTSYLQETAKIGPKNILPFPQVFHSFCEKVRTPMS
jgi:hypothetical protein